MGMGGVAQQERASGPQAKDFGGDGVVGGLTSRDPHAPHLLAQVATLREGQEGLGRRAGVADHRGPVGVHHRGGQAGQFLGKGQGDGLVLFVGQQVLPEQGEEFGQPLVVSRELLLAGRVQGRPRADEVGVVPPGQPLLLEVQALWRLVDLLDPLEEPGVEDHLVAQGRELRRPLPFHGLDLGGAHGGGEEAEESAGPGQRASGVLQGLQGVGEGGRSGVVGDGGDLAPVGGDTRLERGSEELRADLVQRGDPAMSPLPGSQQDVGVDPPPGGQTEGAEEKGGASGAQEGASFHGSCLRLEEGESSREARRPRIRGS